METYKYLILKVRVLVFFYIFASCVLRDREKDNPSHKPSKGFHFSLCWALEKAIGWKVIESMRSFTHLAHASLIRINIGTFKSKVRHFSTRSNVLNVYLPLLLDLESLGRITYTLTSSRMEMEQSRNSLYGNSWVTYW